MWKRENIIEELKQISAVVAGIPPINVYTVPVLYFDELPTIIVQRLKEGSSGLLPSIPAQPVYTVPDGYFEAFPSKILSAIKANKSGSIQEELMAMSPLLASIPKHNVYSVPEGYFEKLKIDNQPIEKAKVIPFRKVMKYAAAAVTISVMAIGGYLFFDKNAQLKSLQSQETNVSAAVNTLSEAEIVNYLENHSTAMEVNSTPFYIPDAGFDVQQVIKDLSDEELQEFLKQNPAPTQGVQQDS
jgi:hypothetical protein